MCTLFDPAPALAVPAPAPARAPAPIPARAVPMFQPLEPRRLLAAGIPRYDHVVVVMEENHDYRDILGVGAIPPVLFPVVPPMVSLQAPFMRALARYGASFSNAHGITHPSQPNYLDLFSGSDQGVSSDATPSGQFSTPSLGGELIASGLSFTGYSEDLPSVGFSGSKSGDYVRRHAPWVDFTDVPAADNRPFSDFPADFTQLPTLSFVVPNLRHDMHSASIRTADKWLKSNIAPFAKWATKHNSLLIVTWDEGRSSNHIPTIFFGAQVKRGKETERLNHFKLLRTLEDMYDLPGVGASVDNGPAKRAFVATTSAAMLPPAAAPSPFSQTPIENVISRLIDDASADTVLAWPKSSSRL